MVSIDEPIPEKDANIRYIGGNLRIKGYFTIKHCSEPSGGNIACYLRPLNAEDV